MKRLLLALALVFSAMPAFSATWYIRDDGGTAAQCTGHTNAAYPGSGTNQACALIHPGFLMAVGSGKAWRTDYIGGDIVQFALNATGGAGTYPMGQKNPTTGRGIDWTAYGIDTGDCFGSGAFNCYLPPLPSGTSGAHTKWLGPCNPSCLNTAGNWTQGAATLSGISQVYNVLNVQGSQWFDVVGINITQYDTCTAAASGSAGHCTGTQDFAGHGIQIEDGTAQGPSNFTFQQMAIYGISAQGLKGSHLNLLSSDTALFDHIFVFGNGMAGFDPDGGGCGTACESVGTLTIQNSDVGFSGCVAVLPIGSINAAGFPSTGVNYCYAQLTNGFGDGIGFLAMGNVIVNLFNNRSRYNTQDGFDLLHMADDASRVQTLNLQNNQALGNMGQTYKVGGATDVNAYNNLSVSDCEAMKIGTAAVFAGFPAGWNTGLQTLADSCRAAGDQWLLALSNGHTIKMIHNTSAGYGDTMYDLVCANTCTTTDKIIFQDNISIGYIRPSTGIAANGIFINAIPDPFANTGSNISYGSWWTMRNSGIEDPSETNAIFTDPLLASQSNIDTFDQRMTNLSSPVLHNGIVGGLTADAVGTTWAVPPSRGAMELVSSAPTVATPTASPVAGTYTSTQAVTLSTVTGGAAICFTTDGSTPTAPTAGTCSGGTTQTYSAAITVASTTTIKALGTLSGDTNSAVASFLYTITPPVVPNFQGSNFSFQGTIKIP